MTRRRCLLIPLLIAIVISAAATWIYLLVHCADAAAAERHARCGRAARQQWSVRSSVQSDANASPSQGTAQYSLPSPRTPWSRHQVVRLNSYGQSILSDPWRFPGTPHRLGDRHNWGARIRPEYVPKLRERVELVEDPVQVSGFVWRARID